MKFSETLQKMMQTKGVTRYRLAKDLGISQSTVTNWLEGRTPHPFMMDSCFNQHQTKVVREDHKR